MEVLNNMLLTIHNLPSSTRYVDVKTLLQDKCGLTEVIVDNLVNEGKNKKVTLGLASEDDGAYVVKKLNGLFINGQQLYIEDRRRPMVNQPYRPASFDQDANTVMQPTKAPNAVWNQSIAAPFMQPVEQNVLAYLSYGGAPQTHYMEPQPVSVAVPRYTAGMADAYAPSELSRNQELSGDWGRISKYQVPDASQNTDRKRRHSPERPFVASKRSSKFDGHNVHNQSKNRREPSPPRHQWAEGNRSFHERFSRQDKNEVNVYQRREPNTDDHSDPIWEQSRWDEPNTREREPQWGSNNRNSQPKSVKVWDNQPQQGRDEPRQWDNPPKPQWESPQKPQWDSPPKPQWESPQKPQWDNPPKPQWESPQKPQWDNPPKPQWEGPRNRDEPKPQWDDRIPVDNSHSEWYDHLECTESSRRNERDYRPKETESMRIRSSPRREPQGRDDRNDRPVASRGRSGYHQQESDYGKPKEYPSREFETRARLPERQRRDEPKAFPRAEIPRREASETYSQVKNKNSFLQEKKTYPPVIPTKGGKRLPYLSETSVNKPVEVRLVPKPISSMINKDLSNRQQATALIAKMVFGLDAGTTYLKKLTKDDNVVFQRLKKCIKSRIDLIFGEELSVTMDDVVERYRSKYPIKDDNIFLNQIREKYENTKEMSLKSSQGKMLKDEAPDVKQAKKGKDATQNNEEKDNKTAETKEVTAKVKVQTMVAAANKPAGPPVPPSMLKRKKGQPLTDKQVIKQTKLLRKWEYDQDDLYSLDDITTKALDDEMAVLDKLFTEECSNPADQQEALICRRITADSLNEFNKAVRLYINKRFLNIPTGLAVRMFASGKNPKKEAVKQYLRKHKIVASAVKKSVKAPMFMINLTKFRDFDLLCKRENDIIDGIPVTFKALQIIGPPAKISKNQIKSMRQKQIKDQIEGYNPDDLEDVDFGAAEDNADTGDNVDTWDNGCREDKKNDWGAGYVEDIAETKLDTGFSEDFATDNFGEIEDVSKVFNVKEEINIDNINEDDLEDF